ncbi:BatA domain-containing protein [Cytophagaceae bacterium ABcell3]|nr:BatA domain-containing protein [Cytophagaceae bacterium ABcell3]
MNFIYPQVLWGLAAVSIPVIIHLFNFQKPRKVLFSNVAFLRHVKDVNSSKLKLKHWLILFARIFFIVFIVLAFAQPYFPAEEEGLTDSMEDVSVYLDNSFSMENELNEEKALDIAVKSVQQLSQNLGAEVKYKVITNDFEGRDQFHRNKNKLAERLSEVTFSPVYRDFESVSKRLDPQPGSSVFLFSDFQKSTAGALENFVADTAVNYFMVPIQNKDVSNIFVDSLWISTPFIKTGENNEITLKLFNDGKGDAKSVLVKLMLDDLQVSSTEVDIPAASSVTTTFTFNISENQPVKGRIVFEDHPVSFDNEYHFVLNPTRGIRVMHVYEESQKYVPAVFSNPKLFDFVSEQVGQINYSAIEGMDVVVLDGLKDLPNSLISTLQEFVAKGGSLTIFPSAGVNKDSYSNLFAQLKLPAVSYTKADTAADNSMYELTPPDYKDPFFRNVFEKDDEKITMPYAKPVVTWTGRGNTLLRTRNNKSYLGQFESSEGSVYLFGAPLHQAYTNMARHAVFVPVMYKIAMNSLNKSERLAYSFQEPTFVLDVGQQAKNQVFKLRNEVAELIPAQRLSGSNLFLELPRDEMDAGIYTLESSSGEKAGYVALNYGKKESLMDFYSAEELSKLFSNSENVKIYDINSSEEFLETFKKASVGTPLWKYFIILCLIFLLTEILLIRFL